MTKLLALVATLPLLLAGCAGVGCVATDYMDGKGIGCGIYIEDVECSADEATNPPHKRLKRCP